MMSLGRVTEVARHALLQCLADTNQYYATHNLGVATYNMTGIATDDDAHSNGGKVEQPIITATRVC